MTARHVFNAERERKQKMNLIRVLEEHDKEVERLRLLFAGDEEPSDEGLGLDESLEKLRDHTVSALHSLLYMAEYSFKDTMRKGAYELLQLADDVLSVNEEATQLSRVFELEANTPEQVRVEWMGEDFGKLVSQLALVRRTLVLATALIGPELAMRASEHLVDRLFGHKPQKPQTQDSRPQNTTVRVEAAPSRREEKPKKG